MKRYIIIIISVIICIAIGVLIVLNYKRDKGIQIKKDITRAYSEENNQKCEDSMSIYIKL